MESYKLVEQFNNYQQPIGSVIDTGGEKVFYRNISDKHVFKKGNYKALFIDDAVVNWLLSNDKITSVVFDYDGTSGVKTYKVDFNKYVQAKPVTMAGRQQRGLSVETFILKDEATKLPRPVESVFIKA